MPARVADTIVYPTLGSYRDDGSQRTWQIAGVAGASLFDPAAHPRDAERVHTACWWGYHCGYLVRDAALLLTRVTCGVRRRDVERIGTPKLFGLPMRPVGAMPTRFDPRTPRCPADPSMPAGEYLLDGLCAPMEFTGGLLLGRSHLKEPVEPLGSWSAYHRYDSVAELTFQDGRLQDARDLSEAMTRYRSAHSAWAARLVRPWYRRWFQPLDTDAPPRLPLAHRY